MMNSSIRTVGVVLVFACALIRGAEADNAPNQLRVGIVQMSLGRTLAENRDRIVAGITNTAAHRVRVAVFPEGALRGIDGDQPAVVDQAVSAIQQAAREAKMFVLFGGCTHSARLKKNSNWMRVIGPEGREVFRYEKLYDNHRATMPGVFFIDGIPCSAIICADRWLRGIEEIPIQRGAQISFELSCNFASEWIAPFGWYWYVPRALRNNVWVIFANTGNKVSGVSDDPSAPRELRHGHTAIIAPDGRIVAAARDDVETTVVADLDVSQATRAAALARAAHPALRKLWETGVKLQRGQTVEAPPLKPLTSPETDITLAVAQVAGDVAAMETMIGQARAKRADLIAFPARAMAETVLERLQAAAREHRITVVVGVEHRGEGDRRNSAFVIGPDGSLLTRYDQLSATAPFQPGEDPSAMWFRVKGVPAVVTVDGDALWTELAELAAVAGAQIHVHLDHDPANDQDAALRRVQVWSNLASFQTLSAMANVVGSAIWDDVRDAEERRAEVYDLPRPDTGAAKVPSPFSANLVVQAGENSQLITATRRVSPKNRYHPARTSNNDPDDWIASPVTLAILAEAGLKDRLVHFDYNCILPLSNPDWEKLHADSVLGAVERYEFDKSRFFDCRRKLDAAVADIAQAINDSSAENPLYFIIAGPMEVPYQGIQESDPGKRKFVYCISHSRWNDGFASKYRFAFTKRSVIEQDVRWVQIRDQNRLLSFGRYGTPSPPEDFKPFFWLRDSRDAKVRWLWERILVSTRPDPSDAGMTWFLVTGDEECDPAKLKRLLDDHRPLAPVAARQQVRIEAENFRHLEGFVLEDQKDKNASHQLNVRLGDGVTRGHMRTHFDEPFTRATGRYDVVIRYLDEKGLRCRYTMCVNGAARGNTWTSAGGGRGWLSQNLAGLEIRKGDDIRVDADGEGGRLDYVQLDFVEP